MDSTAIQEIQANAAAIEAQKAVDKGADHDAVLVPPGYGLKSLEAYSKTRDHFTGCYATANSDHFVTYCGDNDAQRIFIDGEKFRAVAFFDIGKPAAPGHAKHRAILTLKKTAAFVALQGFADQELSQQEAAETFEDWIDYMTALDASSANISNAKALMAIRNVKINKQAEQHHTNENLSESRSLMESIEASSEHTLPAWLTFTCHPYLHLRERKFLLRVSVITRDGKLFFKFRLADMEKAREEMAEEFADSLVNDLEGPSDAETPPLATRIYIGTFET